MGKSIIYVLLLHYPCRAHITSWNSFCQSLYSAPFEQPESPKYVLVRRMLWLRG